MRKHEERTAVIVDYNHGGSYINRRNLKGCSRVRSLNGDV